MSSEHQQIVADTLGAITAAGWPAKITDAGDLLVELDTRAAGRFAATLHVHGEGPHRGLETQAALRLCYVELVDISNSSDISRRAVDALLLALPAAVPFVSGLVMARDGATICAVSAPIEDMGAGSIDRSLCTLTVACELVGREVRALCDEHLAADFIAMLNTCDREPEPVHPRGGRPMSATAVADLGFEVSDVTGQKVLAVSNVPDETTVSDLVRGLIDRMRLPANDAGGRPLTYHARLDREGRHLQGTERVRESVQSGDRVVLQPNVDAG